MFSGGANNFGSQRSIINFLSFRSGKMNFLPSETEIVYEFKRSINSNETYTVTGNIVAAADQSCLAGNSDDSSQFDSDPFPGAPEIPFNDQLNMMKHPYMDDLKAMSEPDYDASLSLKPTDSDIVSWDIYTSLKNEKLGVLRLDSFMPSNDTTGGMKTVLTIRSLLLNELANTDSLVIDIRDNGGGLITIANFIPQFFTKDFVPGTGRALISPINEIMFTQTPQFKDSIWDTAYRSTPPGSIYSNRVMFNTKDESNDFGQVYFKPVAVFNNAQCYSACDKFSANMQDSAGAIVFGEGIYHLI